MNFLGFFPNPKIIYDPQSLNDTFYESIWANTSVFDYELLVQAKLNGSHSLWNLSWGSPDPNINTSYYDVAYWGPDTTTLSNLGVIIDGISEETDIISFVNADEKDIYGIRIGFSVLSLFLIWLLSN